jgi:hypothetical protein
MKLQIPSHGCPGKEVLCDAAFNDAIQKATAGVQPLLEAMRHAASFAQQSSPRLRVISESVEGNPSSASVNTGPITKVILLANITRATSSGRLRVSKIESEFNVRVITIKLCQSMPQLDQNKNLVHISADFKNGDGIKEVLRQLTIHKISAPWALILDHAGVEPIGYGNK